MRSDAQPCVAGGYFLVSIFILLLIAELISIYTQLIERLSSIYYLSTTIIIY